MQMVQILEFVSAAFLKLACILFSLLFYCIMWIGSSTSVVWVRNFVHNSCFGSRRLDGLTKHEWCNLSSEINPDSWFCDFQWGFFWICTDRFSSASVHDGSSFDSSLRNISAKEWCNLRLTLIPERDVWLSSSWICIYCFEYNCVWFICVWFQTLKSNSAREWCNRRTEINPCIWKGFSTVFLLIVKIAIEGLVCREWG